MIVTEGDLAATPMTKNIEGIVILTKEADIDDLVPNQLTKSTLFIKLVEGGNIREAPVGLRIENSIEEQVKSPKNKFVRKWSRR